MVKLVCWERLANYSHLAVWLQMMKLHGTYCCLNTLLLNSLQFRRSLRSLYHLALSSTFSSLKILPKDTGAGPSGLRVQHLLDVSSTALPTPICASLREVINLLASGKASPTVSKYLAGGNLITLNKFKEGCPPDIRPIVIGEAHWPMYLCSNQVKGLKLFSTFTTRSRHQYRCRKNYT